MKLNCKRIDFTYIPGEEIFNFPEESGLPFLFDVEEELTGDPAVIEIELAQADGCGQHIVSASLEEPATLVLALEWDVPRSPVGLESCGYSLEVFRHSLTSAELIGEEIEEVQIVDATRTKLDPLPLG